MPISSNVREKQEPSEHEDDIVRTADTAARSALKRLLGLRIDLTAFYRFGAATAR